MSLRAPLGPAALVLILSGVALVAPRLTLTAQPDSSSERTFSISAKRYSFIPGRIDVTEGDLVRIELRTEDIAHSLTIDAYRLAKRVDPGQPVVLEFRAEQPGMFPFYCNLQIDEGCRRMHGEFVVRPRR